MSDSLLILAWGGIGWTEILILAVVGLLIFGKRLPEVGRSLGKGIVEFKKGLAGIEDDIDQAAKSPPSPPKQLKQDTSVSATDAQTQQPSPMDRSPRGDA